MSIQNQQVIFEIFDKVKTLYIIYLYIEIL